MKQIQITLTPSESKRIIAMGVKRLPIVQQASKKGIILIPLGTTNAYITEELTGEMVDYTKYAEGIIDGKTNIVPKEKRLSMIALRDGMHVESKGIIDEMGSQDVVIKGANAIDPQGVAGVMQGPPHGGTTGSIIGAIMAKGINLVIPVGLEKSIPYSVVEISKRIGAQRCSKATGLKIGMMPLCGKVITEVQALTLHGAEDVFPIGAGGINGGEGSITLCVIGEKVDDIFDIVQKIKEKKTMQ